MGGYTVTLSDLRNVFEVALKSGAAVRLGLREIDIRIPIANKMDTNPILRAVRPVCLKSL